ncbi:MAG: glycerol acyltransferase, partial [Sphaerochaeta sp.]|nr:glycerol acyltransferase [Sphaerochaeta sp.]
MDLTRYRDISPYRGQDARDAVNRVLENKQALIGMLASLQASDDLSQQEESKKFAHYLLQVLETVQSYDDFQRNITAGIFLPAIIKKSVDQFTVTGLEHTEKDKA